MSDLSARIATLSPERLLLLELLKREEQAQANASVPAAAARHGGPFSLVREVDRARLPAGLEDAYPLASMQMGMLYHMNLTLDDPVPAYHNVFLFNIGFPVNVEALRQCIRCLVRRHAVLRTSFDLTNFSEPLQLVHREVDVTMGHVDLRSLPSDAQEREIETFLRLENRRVVDITRPPLLRFLVHQLAADRFCLTMTELHAIAEGWGTYRTLEEIRRTYVAIVAGEPLPDQAAPAVEYREFIRLEREALGSEECRRYWNEKLRDATVSRLPRWPAAYRRKAHTLDRTRVFNIEPALVGSLLQLVREVELPLKSILFAAHLKVVAMLVGRGDLLTGLSVHNRPEQLGGDQVLGSFVNTVPFRFVLKPGSWAELARSVFEAEVELMPFTRYPLAAIQREWGKESLVEVAFGYTNFHLFGQAPRMRGVEVGSGADWSVSHFPLVVFFRGYPGPTLNMDVWMENDDTEIAEAQMRALAGYYRNVLEAMVADPHGPHDRESFLSAAERHLQLVEWNDTQARYPGDRCAHELIAAQAGRTPDAVAVICEEGHLSYGELVRRARRLARRLRSLGVKPEERVGVCLERSPELLVALLAVLEAGGSFVPMDPSHPLERLAFIAEDACLLVLIAQGAAIAGFAESRMRVLDVELPEQEDQAGALDPPARIGPQSLAYIIYTSGSTGRPKGVMVPHRGLVNYLDWATTTYDLAAGRGAPVHSSVAVDLMITSLLAPLLAGCAAILIPERQRGDALDAMLGLDSGLSLLKLTPSHLDALNQRLSPKRLAAWTHALVLGGEQLRGESLAFWARHAPATRVINEYGPTETVVGCAVHEVAASGVHPGPVPIGRPIANTQLYVLDPEFLSLPVGVTGELFVGGDGVGRGYFGRPDLTAERFVPHPFDDQGGRRLYRTGDQVRRWPDGTLEFLGRRDQQVKVRGFRIELGEIEASLAAHPGVREAVVVAREDGPGRRRVVAYIVPSGEERPTAGQLRAFLRRSLPDFMVPAAFVHLDALPLAPSGKLDRRALPAPTADRPELDDAFVAPQGEMEKAIAELWREVLQVDRIGAHDNFFELGGDSLQLLRVHLKVQEQFAADLTISDLFRYPTVSSLAARLAGGGKAESSLEHGDRRAAARLASARRQAEARAQRLARRQREEEPNG